jgi:hypothetical protein
MNNKGRKVFKKFMNYLVTPPKYLFIAVLLNSDRLSRLTEKLDRSGFVKRPAGATTQSNPGTKILITYNSFMNIY